MAKLQLDGVGNVVKDAAYVSIGLGVIAFQRMQVRRNELQKVLGGVGEVLGDRVKVVEERLGAAVGRDR
jgi:hypothetical protein